MLAVIAHGLRVSVASPIQPDASDQHIANEKAYRANLAKDSLALLSWNGEGRRWTGYINGVTAEGETSWKGACCSAGLIPNFKPELLALDCGVVAVLPPDRETSMELKKPRIVKAIETLLRLATPSWVGYVPGDQLSMPSCCREPASRQGKADEAASSAGRRWAMPSFCLTTTLPPFVVVDWAVYQELYHKQLPNGIGFQKSDALGALADQFMAGRAAASGQRQAANQPSKQDIAQPVSSGPDCVQAAEGEEGVRASAAATPRDGSPQPPDSRRSSANTSPLPTKSAGTTSPASSSASNRSQCPPRQRGQAAAVSQGPPARALSRLDSTLKDADAEPLSYLEATDSTQRMTRARRRQLEEKPAGQRPSPPPSLLPLRISGEAGTRRGPPLNKNH